MKFPLPAAVTFGLSLLGTAGAARIETYYNYGPGWIPAGETWHISNDGRGVVFPNWWDGCTGSKEGIRGFCIDREKQRAHVDYHSGLKRCFRQSFSSDEECGGSESCWKGICNRCVKIFYEEAQCNW